MKFRLQIILVNVCRLFVGITFVASGMAKTLDPAGMEHKLLAYLRSWNVFTWTEDTSWLTAMVLTLATIEFLLGIWLLIGMRRRFTTICTALATLLFTLLTIYIYIVSPVPDCGCFGDAIKLSHGETLLKNIVLLALCIPLVVWPLKIIPLLRRKSYWLPSLYAVAFVLACGIYSSNRIPLVDFTSYVPGYAFTAAMEGQYGEKGIEDAFNFAVLDTASNDITPDVIQAQGYTFLVLSANLDQADYSVSDRINEIYRRSQEIADCRFFFLTASDSAAFARWKDRAAAEYTTNHTDESVIDAAAKTNPGLLLLHNDTIVAKWNKHNLPELYDTQNKPIPLYRLAQKPQNKAQKLLKIALWLFVPMIFLIFADSLAAGIVTLRRRSLRRLAHARMETNKNTAS